LDGWHCGGGARRGNGFGVVTLGTGLLGWK
jgi:hypothetical protein